MWTRIKYEVLSLNKNYFLLRTVGNTAFICHRVLEGFGNDKRRLKLIELCSIQGSEHLVYICHIVEFFQQQSYSVPVGKLHMKPNCSHRVLWWVWNQNQKSIAFVTISLLNICLSLRSERLCSWVWFISCLGESWIGTFAFRASSFSCFCGWLPPAPNSDRYWPGRDRFFKMIVLEFLLQMKHLENLSGYSNTYLFSSSKVYRKAMI